MPKLPAPGPETSTISLNELKALDIFVSAHSRIKICCVQVYNVDSFAFDGRVERVLWRCSEVSTMKVPEHSS